MELFSITTLLILAVIILIFLWYFRFEITSAQQLPDQNIHLWIGYGLMGILVLWSLPTLNSYLRADYDIYKNTHYHTLVHQGYSFFNHLDLVDSDMPSKSLWDDKIGKARIEAHRTDSVKLTVKRLKEPFYLRQRPLPPNIFRRVLNLIRDKTVRPFIPTIDQQVREQETYALFNPVVPNPIEQKLSIYWGKDMNQAAIEISITDFEKDSTHYEVKTNAMGIARKSDFNFYLNQGYSLTDIILQTDSLEKSIEVENILERLDGSYLLRDKILTNRKANAYKNIQANLLLFPGAKLYDNPDSITLFVDSVQVDWTHLDTTYQQIIPNRFSFFSGLGYRSSPVLHLSQLGEKFNLNYAFPTRYALNQEADTASLIQHFLTSRNNDINQSNFPGGYLFDQFSRDDHRFHFSARLSYVPGRSRDSLHFNVLDHNKLNREGVQAGKSQDSTHVAGSLIQLTTESFFDETDKQGFSWNFRITDLRGTSALQPWMIYLFILLFMGFLGYRIFYVNREVNHFSSSELALYVIFYVFVIIKLILLWRMYTFPPLDKAIFYNNLRSGSHLYSTLIPILLFGILLGAHFWQRAKEKSLLSTFWDRVSELQEGMDSNHLGFYLLLFLLINVFFLVFSPRFFNIGMPLSLFFLGNWWLKDLSSAHIEDIGPKSIFAEWQALGRLAWTSLSEQNIYVKIISWIGIVIATPIILIVAGYTLWILLWGIGSWVFHNWILASILLGSIAFCVLLYYTLAVWFPQTFFINGVQNGRTYFRKVGSGFASRPNNYAVLAKIIIDAGAVGLLLVLDMGFGIIFGMFYFLHQILGGMMFEQGWFSQVTRLRAPQSDWQRWLIGAAMIGVFFAVILLQNAIISQGLDILDDKFSAAKAKSYVKYRAAIQNPKQSVSELIEKNKFQSLEVRQILNASHNQWFINKYIVPDTNQLDQPYFNLRSHFDQGATYTTQTTDLVISRYVIGEHGPIGVILLILLLLMLAWIYISTYYDPEDIHEINSHSFSFLGILLLLFSIAFFVWLTATNRFTFFGQDFPFISLTSKFSTILFLALIALFLLKNPNDKSQDQTQHHTNAFFGLIAMLGLLTIVFIGYSDTVEREREDTSYNVNRVINYTSQRLKLIDKLFLDYQIKNRNILPTSLDSIVNDFTVFRETKIREIKEPVQANKAGKSQEFFKSAWEYFIDDQTNKRDPDELIHIRKRNGYFRFAVNRNYYFVKGAQDERELLKGDVLAASVDLDYGMFDPLQKNFLPIDEESKKSYIKNYLGKELPDSINNIRITYLDENWSPDGKPQFLVFWGQKGYGKFTIYDGNHTLAQRLNRVYALKERDYFFVFRKDSDQKPAKQFELRQESDKFLSRYIWLNGEPNYHYPLGEKFLWAYHFANLVNKYYEYYPSNQQDSLQQALHALRLSVDYDLTEEVFEIIREFDKPREEIERQAFSAFLNRLDENRNDRIYNVNAEVHLTRGADGLSTAKDADPRIKKAVATIMNGIQRGRRWRRISVQGRKEMLRNEIEEYINGKVDFSITALDGNGRIRLMGDYNRQYRVNPNNIDEYYAFLRRIYAESTVSLEQDYFGNKNLLYVHPGPGSSIKPILYSAVLSQADINWNALQLAPVDSIRQLRIRDQELEGKPVNIYAGQEIKKGWGLDNHNFTSGLSPVSYLEESNNLYHSAVIFLGSYEPEYLKQELYSSILIPQQGKFESNFPIIKLNGNRRFNPDHSAWPRFPNAVFPFGQENSALAEGLYFNYNIPRQPTELTQKMPSGNSIERNYATDTKDFRTTFEHQLFTYADTSSRGLSFWSLPEQSHFLQRQREATGNELIMRAGLIQPTLGSSPVSLTPIKVADMGARLITQNRNFTATFIDTVDAPPAYIPFRSSYDSASVHLRHQQLIYNGLKGVIQGASGTARALKPFTNRYQKDSLYFYAKTGTINIPGDTQRRGKHLLVLITNQQLEGADYDPENIKFYSVFISFHSILYGSGYGKDFEDRDFDSWKIAEDYLEAIIASNSFQNYMFDK